MQRLEVSGVVRPIYGSLGVKRLKTTHWHMQNVYNDVLHVSGTIFCATCFGGRPPLRGVTPTTQAMYMYVCITLN